VPATRTPERDVTPAFARNFERALGQTPMQYLTDWRLTLAREYLLANELTMEQIAHRTGYSSPNAFGRDLPSACRTAARSLAARSLSMRALRRWLAQLLASTAV
jgi:transcriptional regulator GlxA family with amidase domain